MIESQKNKLIFTVGNERVFPFNIKFFNEEDISCYINDGTERKLAASEFQVERKEDYSHGANITLLLDPLPNGATLAIIRELKITQSVSFPLNGKFPSSSNEVALDKLTMIAQQLQEENSRTIKTLPTEETTADALLQSVYASANAAVAAAAAAGESAQQAALTAKDVEAAGKAAVDAAGEAASEAAESAEEVREALRKSAGVPIGAIFAYPGAIPPEGAYLLNGQTITGCNELYPKFWEWVQSAGVRIIDNDTYEAELAETGVCGGFVIDTVAGSVRLPKVVNGTLWGADGSNIGQSLAAGLPNITGTFRTMNCNSRNTATGAFYKAAGGDSQGDSAGAGATYGLDASLSNPIYGNSDTVQPPAIRVSWCIQVYNAATALSEQESAQLASQMQMKAQTDFGNVAENLDFIVKHEEAADGSWWYDLYRSGKVVQGGRTAPAIAPGARTVTMPIEMADTKYTPIATINGESTFHTAGGSICYMAVANLTTTSFDVYESATAGCRSHFWRVEGKAATE